MQDWDPIQYLRFDSERTRPAEELLAQISLMNPTLITDLGCGPGNSTRLLHERWPDAQITGIDSSAAMLARAAEKISGCEFELAEIQQWNAKTPQQLLFANASLQWIPNHGQLLPHLVKQLAPQGVLAIQMPDNLQEPSHLLMREVASLPAWRDHAPLQKAARDPLVSEQYYYRWLVDAGCRVNLWRTTYYHVLPNVSAIVEWLKATGLRPYLNCLTDAEIPAFLGDYQHRLELAYPTQSDGHVLLAFPRLFMVATRT